MKKISFKKITDKVGGFIVKYRIIVLCVCIAIAAFAVYGLTLTNVNSDIMSYLPKGTDTYDGSEFFKQNFNLQSNAVYAIKENSITYDELSAAVEQIKEHETVSAVLWVGSFSELHYGKLTVKNPLAYMEGGEESRQKLEKLFRKDGDYLLIITLSEGASSNEAGEALAAIDSALGDAEFVSGGTAPVSRKVYDDAISELPIYLSVAILLILVVLFIVSANYLEPIVFMTTMGISVLVNMGTNFFFPEISIITFCASSILQLALAMDYSIFLTQIFGEEKAKGIPTNGAMVNAMGLTFNTVLASALTTMGGFAAFFVMSFTLGADLGGVLIKGIALAMITVLVLQPCLLILLNKPMGKTNHKRLVDFKFRKLARFSVSHRVIIVVVFALLLVPAFIGQYFLPLSYLNFMPKTEGDAALCEYVAETSNQILLAVPVDSANPKNNVKLVANIENLDCVSGVTGYYSFLPQQAFDDNGDLVVKVGKNNIAVSADSIGKQMGLISESGYSMYMVSLVSSTGVETDGAMQALNAVRAVVEKECGDTPYYCTGVVQAVADFKVLTPRDFKWITIISVAVIFVVLLLSFRNFVYPFLLVLLIELGTWINFSISTLFGQSLNFLAYIVVGAIQLGATVDYAILVTNRYRSLIKEGTEPLEAAYESGTSCTMSILTSATIMAVACLSVTVVSSNAVIKEITMMVMRGAVISTLLVLFVLPSILACTSRLRLRAVEAGGMKNLTANFLNATNQKVVSAKNLAMAKRRVKKENLCREGETLEDLQCRGTVLIQSKKGYRFNSDSVILANLVEVQSGQTVADFGCGNGVISILVAAKRGVKVCGVEIQPEMADRARRSVAASGLGDKITVYDGDIATAEQLLGADRFDAVVCNPPYYKQGSGAVSDNPEQAVARHEVKITLKDIVISARKVLKQEGELYIIVPTYREKELDALAAEVMLRSTRKVYLAAKKDEAPASVIATFAKTDSACECAVRTIVTKSEQGGMSDEVAKMYRS